VKYMLTIAGDPDSVPEQSPEEREQEMGRWFSYTEELQKSGAMVAGEALQGKETATTVHFGDGEPSLTDGPFTETKEQIGGFYLIDVANLDEALDWAKKIPARGGVVEVRPVMEFEQ
jgi:hypothetical protein